MRDGQGRWVGVGAGAGAGAEHISNADVEATCGTVTVTFDKYRIQKRKKLENSKRQIISDKESVFIYLSGEPEAWIKKADGSYVSKSG